MKSKNDLLLKGITFTLIFATSLFVMKKQVYAADNSNVNRQEIIGSNRYETSILISREIDNFYNTQQLNNDCQNVVLVNGTALSDALCAVPFAEYKRARILLTDTNTIPNQTLAEIDRINPDNIYLIGGTGVVSTNIEKQLEDRCSSITRIGGTDRFETSKMIATALEGTEAISIVNGIKGMADAISIAAPAAQNKTAILLTSDSNNSRCLNEYIESNNSISTAYIIGGTGVLPESLLTKVNSDIPNIERLGGANRNETNSMVINKFYTGDTIKNLYVAKDGAGKENELVDALSVGVLACKYRCPVMIVNSSITDSQRIIVKNKSIENIVQVGGGGNETACDELVDTCKGKMTLTVKFMSQNPELPTGCEATSCAMMLNYYLGGVDKCDVADNYLDKGPLNSTNPWKAFVGNPRSKHAYGAYAPVLVKTADRYLSSHGSCRRAYDKTGAALDSLLPFIDEGHPVMIWATMNMVPSSDGPVWYADGEKVQWKNNEHCLLLIGYTADKYIIADPLKGIVEYDRELVNQRYGELWNQAVVVY